jgi:hypothetical protein
MSPVKYELGLYIPEDGILHMGSSMNGIIITMTRPEAKVTAATQYSECGLGTRVSCFWQKQKYVPSVQKHYDASATYKNSSRAVTRSNAHPNVVPMSRICGDKPQIPLKNALFYDVTSYASC